MHVILFLNHACNLRCRYCYNGAKFDRSMDDAMIHKGIDLAFSRGPARLSFFGGEPLLAFDSIKFAVAEARKKAAETGIALKRFSTTTNGTLLTDAHLDFFRTEGFRLSVSLDGTREVNDANRLLEDGTSSYDSVVRSVASALPLFDDLHISATVQPETVHRMADSFAHILDLGAKSISLNFDYSAPWTEETLEIWRDQLIQVADLYVAAWRRGVALEYPSFVGKIRTHIEGGYEKVGNCPFGDGELTLTPSGRLYPCERLVGEDPEDGPLCIGDIDRGVDLQKVLDFARARNTPEEQCRDCSVLKRCVRFCGCVSHETTGVIGSVSGLVCAVEQHLIAQADRAAGILFSEKNPAFLKKFYPV